MGVAGKPGMIVFNKIDAYTYVEKAEDDLTPKTKENITLEELMNTWMAKLDDNCFFISAKEKTNMDELPWKRFNIVFVIWKMTAQKDLVAILVHK